MFSLCRPFRAWGHFARIPQGLRPGLAVFRPYGAGCFVLWHLCYVFVGMVLRMTRAWRGFGERGGGYGWFGMGRWRVCITFALFRSFVLHLFQLYLRAILLSHAGCLHDISAQSPGIPDPLLRTAVWTYEID